MKPENRKFLNDNRGCLNEILNAGTAKKAFHIRYELLRIMHEDFIPGYVMNEDCSSCPYLFDMTKLLYAMFDKLPVPSPVTEEVRPGVVHAVFPVNDPPAEKKKHVFYRDPSGKVISKAKWKSLYGKELI